MTWRSPGPRLKSEVEGVVAGVAAHVEGSKLLERDAPCAAVGQRAEVDLAGLLPRLSGPVQKEEGIALMAGLHGALLDHTDAHRQALACGRELSCPRAGDRGQLGGAIREVQRGKGQGFNVQGLLARVLHFAPPLDDVVLRE